MKKLNDYRFQFESSGRSINSFTLYAPYIPFFDLFDNCEMDLESAFLGKILTERLFVFDDENSEEGYRLEKLMMYPSEAIELVEECIKSANTAINILKKFRDS